jgi:hypothetical protein
LQGLSLRLALNLSHDKEFRQLFLKKEISKDLITILNKKNYIIITLQLLYHLSVDKESRTSPVFEEVVPIVKIQIT